MNLKKISPTSVPRALELGERYRLLNEPEQAASICRDVLEVDEGNQEAARTLLLALTDQFDKKRGASLQDAERAMDHITGEYERAYYRGVVYERWCRSLIQSGAPAYSAGEWLQKAMASYEEAERIRPPGDDASLLRWNTCARLIARSPDLMAESDAHEMHFGD